MGIKQKGSWAQSLFVILGLFHRLSLWSLCSSFKDILAVAVGPLGGCCRDLPCSPVTQPFCGSTIANLNETASLIVGSSPTCSIAFCCFEGISMLRRLEVSSDLLPDGVVTTIQRSLSRPWPCHACHCMFAVHDDYIIGWHKSARLC